MRGQRKEMDRNKTGMPVAPWLPNVKVRTIRCLLALLCGMVGAAMASAPAKAPSRAGEGFHTLIQTASPYEAKANLQVDLALVAADESERGLKGAAANVKSWQGRGYRVFGFASVARVYDYYMQGGWRDLQGGIDPGNHRGEIQRDRFGARFGPHEFMLMPSLSLIEHKKLWAQAFIDAGVEGMAYEEPDLFMDGGYCDQFKKEWQEYYGQPWQPPHSSIAARWKSERLKAHLGFRSYKLLSQFCKDRAGKGFTFMLATHSLPNYLLWGVSFNYFDTLSLPSVDLLQAQVWTGTAKTPVLVEGELQERLLENAFLDYSYAANLTEALKKGVSLNLDPYEDDPDLSFDFYKKGFEHTLAASLMFPKVGTWEILPWPNRIYTNDRIPPLYGTEIQNVLTAMTAMGASTKHAWSSVSPRTGILFSESALYEMRDPYPSNPQSLFALALPLLSMGIPVDVVPLEATTVASYLDPFRILFLSYDSYKPLKPEVHTALARWVKERGGVLVLLGGDSAYNAAPMWWQEAGYSSPMAHLLAQLGLGSRTTTYLAQRPGDIHYLPTDTKDAPYAKLLADFFKDIHGADFAPRAVSFVPNDRQPELNYLDTQVGPGSSRGNLRYADAGGFFTYKFDTSGVRDFKIRVDIANTYLIEASTDQVQWTTLVNSLEEAGGEVRDGSNRKERELDLTPFLSQNTVYLRFRDPTPQNGWGPAVRKITLLPERDAPAPTVEAPLTLRDAYAVGYTSITGNRRVFIQGAGNPVAFATRVGKGEVFVLGAPPALFGSSKAKSQALQMLYRELCRSRKLPLRADGVLHVTRGDYQIVYPVSRDTRLKGRFLDVLSPDLEMVEDPQIPLGQPRILLSVAARLKEARPALLFASHRSSGLQVSKDRIEFTVEGPERIPAACRLFTSNRQLKSVTCQRVRDGQTITPLIRSDPDGTLYLRFENQEHGVRVSVVL